MNDRELLKAAAKAAGLSHPDGWDWIKNPDGFKWNPLESDADAFRLAVALRITVQFPWDDNLRTMKETHCWTESNYPVEESHGADPAAATRRAIVRAAAALKDTA